ncbi:MAG: nucleotidyltransferase family protein [Chitinophagales bacterium]
MKAMLFAAGLGTRLKPFTDHCPKALVEVNNKTLLEHNIRYLQRFGIYEVIVNVHHFAEMIEEILYEHDGFGSNISVSDERKELLETGGGLKKAGPFFADEDSFVVMNVDVLTNLDLGKMIIAHHDGEAIATLAVMQRESSRQLLFDKNMHLCGWVNNKTHEERIARQDMPLQPFAFSGIQVLSRAVLNDMPFEGKFSLIDLYLYLAKSHALKGYDHTGNIFIDVGKPESIEKAAYLFR